ncbi:hypothetical protein NS226_21845 [Aureimonas ureilytica]|uniref:Peptidoglycan binding-like domain-containing protein n=1 Tax=Aureimonas ureilytica TaxID=401562 RepID=A0A175R2R6_9HYPH|nr:TIGR02594 family protein [Aureimonas ureilytica]KTQ84203.1 hypothetical protein NS226_21845 [Aureimonas ureilytica]
MIYPTKIIQERLNELGYDPGPIDGVRGRRTIAAIRQFQTDKGLMVDGIVGPATRGKLFAGAETILLGTEPDRPWYEEARRLMGTKEQPGPGSNPVIEDWAKDLAIPYAGDDVPWCGLFVAHCIGATLPGEELPRGLLRARNWLGFGKECQPSKGCILVFWRDPKASGVGHVGFYAGEDDKGFYVLGGNQSNAVNIKRLSRNQFLGARWPSSAYYGQQEKVLLTPETNAFETALS